MCNRYFPQQHLQPGFQVTDAWVPKYLARIGDREEYIQIHDVKSDECPTSLLHRHSELYQLVKEIDMASSVKEETGAYPFGPDSSKWPVRWFDAIRFAQMERSRTKRAYEDEMDSRRGGQ